MGALDNLSSSMEIDRSYDENKITKFLDNPVTIKWIDAVTKKFRGMWVVTKVDKKEKGMITVVACPTEVTEEANGCIYNYGRLLMEQYPGVYGLANLIIPD